MFISKVARQKPPQNWEFVLPTDIDFLQKHQDVVKFQIDVWNDLVARFVVSSSFLLPHFYFLIFQSHVF